MDAVKRLLHRVNELIESLPAKKIDLGLAVAVTIFGMVVFAFVDIGGNSRGAFAFVRSVELKVLDTLFQTRGPREHDDRIVIVGIDEKTLQKVGSWPISRAAYAKMVDQLSAGGARIVALDVTFPTPEKNSAVEALKKLEEELGPNAPATVVDKIRAIEQTSDNDATFAASMQKAGNVILGHIFLDAEHAQAIDEKATEDYFNILWAKPFPQVHKVTSGRDFDLGKAWCKPDQFNNCTNGQVFQGIESNIRILAEAARSYGYFNQVPDNDGTMRRAVMLVRYRDRDFFPSLTLQVIREYENIKDQSIDASVAENGIESLALGPHNIPLNHDGTVLINYTGPFHTYQHYSMADVMDGTVPASTFKDKIVLVGATAIGIGDLRSTPFGKQDIGYMGVEIHANVLDNLLHNEEKGKGFLSRGYGEEGIGIFFILVFGLGLGYWFSRTKPLYATLSVVLAVAAYWGIEYFAFAKMGRWLSFVIPAGTLVLNYAVITSFRMIFEEREKRKIRKNFSSYVSPGVIALVEKDPKKYFKAGGEMKELTIMFSDIRSFTTISEGLTPNELVELLNEYLGEMTEIIFKRWGTLDKYIGDAIMAFWGSPYPQEDHHMRSCAAALDMIARLEELNLKWEAMGKKTLSAGIGINTGPVNVGNMGSSKRLAWTVMGDNVNLSSRLEGQTKEYHTKIIIGEGTYQAVKDHFVLRDLDKIRVKGKLKPVNIYELIAWGKEAAQHQERIKKWNDAMNDYRRGWWSVALKKFSEIQEKYNDGPSITFIERCEEKIEEHAPEMEWDGVYVAKTK